MKENYKVPKDLGVKIGTPAEAEWKRILETQKESLVNSKINVKVAEHMLKLCEKEIAEEKEKFK